MKCLIISYTFVIILVQVNSSRNHCVFEGSNRNEARCGIHDTDSIFYSIPEILRDITYIDLWGQPLKQLPNNAFKDLQSQRNVTTVALAFCQIVHIDVDAFMNLDNLELVNLSFNNISQIVVGTFQNIPKVKYIFLEYNHISVLPKGFLQNLTALQHVHLDNNRIVHIEEDAFKNTPDLHCIDLSHNNLQTLDMAFKDYLDNETYLYLHNNPWTCDDGFNGIYNYFLQSINKYDIKYIPRCENPLKFRGRKWNEISLDVIRHNITPLKLDDDREEPPKISLIALLVGEISFISLYAIVIAMAMCVYWIRLFIYTMVHRLCGRSTTV